MKTLTETASARTPDGGPGLIVRLRPRRVYLIAVDAAQQQEIEPLARAVAALLDLAGEPEVAA